MLDIIPIGQNVKEIYETYVYLKIKMTMVINEMSSVDFVMPLVQHPNYTEIHT